MPIDNIPDWEARIARHDAFWDGTIIDRPLVCISVPREPGVEIPTPPADVRQRWLDADYVAAKAVATVRNCEYLGDALPLIFPNLGPDLFAAFFGCELEFGEATSWSVPALDDWAHLDRLQFSRDNFYWEKLVEQTDALLAAGRGLFYTGITDIHPGGDAIAAFRDPLNLNYDMIEAVDEVKALLRDVTDSYFEVYDFFYGRLAAADQPCAAWMGIVSTRKWYIPSNDFSCMVSKEMFDDVFLPGIIDECRHLEASIYHLDGPGALQHLDSLLGIPELNVIQWVYGAGNGRASDWMQVYRKCQAAGKGIYLGLEPDELDFFMANLHPEGVWLGISGVQTPAEAEALIRKVSTWRS